MIFLVYVKVALYLRKKRIRSRKSPIRRVQQEIQFNDTFHVNIASQVLNDVRNKLKNNF